VLALNWKWASLSAMRNSSVRTKRLHFGAVPDP
jgi:hypothetical protein